MAIAGPPRSDWPSVEGRMGPMPGKRGNRTCPICATNRPGGKIGPRCEPSSQECLLGKQDLVLLRPRYQIFGALGPLERYQGPPILQMTSGPDSNGFTHCFVVCSPRGGPRLPARRLRPPIAWSYGLSDPAEDDHRTRSSSPNDLVFSHLEVLAENRSEASSPVG